MQSRNQCKLQFIMTVHNIHMSFDEHSQVKIFRSEIKLNIKEKLDSTYVFGIYPSTIIEYSCFSYQINWMNHTSSNEYESIDSFHWNLKPHEQKISNKRKYNPWNMLFKNFYSKNNRYNTNQKEIVSIHDFIIKFSNQQ